MNKDSLLDDMEVRFAEEDREVYGDQWYTYSELEIVSMRARDLVALEALIGVPMPTIMDNFRTDATFANLACAWIAAGRPGSFKDFNPLIMQAEWRVKKAEAEPGKSPASAPSIESEPGVTDTAPEGFGSLPTTPDSASTS